MTAETDNLPRGGTDDARALSLDEAAALDIPEIEEGDDADAPGAEAAAPSETEEPADTPEDTSPGAENDVPGAEPTAEPDDTATVTVAGERLTVADLKGGYLRQADYSRKIQEVAARRRDLEAMTERVMQSAAGLADFLARQVPDAPDPALAQSDPAAYVQRKAAHDAALAQVQSIFAQSEQAQSARNTLTQQQHAELLAREDAKLAEAFPQTATDAGRKAFFDAAASAARDLGYAPEEIAAVTDHRMFALAHYAAIGFRAEQAKATAERKVAHVPPVAPPKRQKTAEAASAARNRDAMKKLARSGSIEDAMAIDFD